MLQRRTKILIGCCLTVLLSMPIGALAQIALPEYSDLMSEASKAGLAKQKLLNDKAIKACNPYEQDTSQQIRDCEAQFYEPIMAVAKNKYPDLEIQAKIIAGVQTDIISPATIAAHKSDKILINLHGGGFKYGARFGGQLESMPIAHHGGYKVVSIDYRKAPDHRFPAGVDDVEKVYRALLNDYSANNIGIFGCSAGSRLAGQSLYRFSQQKLPIPAAAVFLCSAPTGLKGDSNITAAAIANKAPLTLDMVQYWQGLSANDISAFPGEHRSALQNFPPALLITSTRDYALSTMVKMHSDLVALHKVAELHIFEGFAHAQFMSMYVPESRETSRIMVDFFDRHLGHQGQ